MRIAEYKQIDTKLEQKIIHHDAEYNEQGEIIIEDYDEEIIVEVPVMGMVYRDATPEEEAEIFFTSQLTTTTEQRIDELKACLAATDYKAIKYAEGWMTEEEYAPIKAEREAIREQIRQLEA